jgi:hypothetical protein
MSWVQTFPNDPRDHIADGFVDAFSPENQWKQECIHGCFLMKLAILCNCSHKHTRSWLFEKQQLGKDG